MILKERIVKDTLRYTIANYVAMVIGIFVSIGTKAILGTVGAGYWALLKMFSSYAEMSDLGAREAMLRELPQALGAGETARGTKIQNCAFSFSSVMSALSGLAIIAIAFFIVKDPALRRGLLVISMVAVATQTYNFMLSFLRTFKKIAALSGVITVNILLVAAFSLAAAWWKGVVGLALGILAATSISAWNAYRVSGIKISIDWDWREILRLISIGIPMVVAGSMLVLFLSVDSMMIGKMIGVQALGLYTIALMAVQQVGTLGRFSQIVLYPYIQELYGHDRSLDATRQIFVRTTTALMYFLPVIIGAISFLIPVIVHYFIPKFSGGLPSMKILVLGYFFIAISELAPTLLFTIDKQRTLIPVFAALLLAGAGLNYVFIRAGAGIEGVAVATSIAYFFYFIAVFYYAFKRILQGKVLMRLMASIVGMFVYLAFWVMVIDHFVRVPGFLLESLVKCAAITAVFLPFILMYERQEHIMTMLFKVFKAKGLAFVKEWGPARDQLPP